MLNILESKIGHVHESNLSPFLLPFDTHNRKFNSYAVLM